MFYVFVFVVEDMIKEVDVDGDGRIDFYGKYNTTQDRYMKYYYVIR